MQMLELHIKNFKADAVISTSFLKKIRIQIMHYYFVRRKINPKLAGIENRSESSKDLFCISEIFLIFFILKALERTGKETISSYSL